MSNVVLFLDVVFFLIFAGLVVYTVNKVKVGPQKYKEEFSIRKLSKLLRKRS